MNKETKDAFNLITQICGEFVGKLQDHQKIQHALSVVKEAIKPEEVENEKE